MALNSTHFFDVDPISPKSNRVAHPDSGILRETLLKDEVGMAMPKSTQTRFLGIRDNHNHYTSLRLLFYRLIDVDLSKACYTWSILDLHVGEITLLVIYDPHATQKSKRRD